MSLSDVSSLFQLGGPVMWPLLACSVIGLAVIIDRAWMHFSTRLDFDTYLKNLKSAQSEGRVKSFLEKFAHSQNPVVKLTQVYFAYLIKGEHRRNEALKREGSRLLAAQDRRMRLLATVAHVAPLLGLLGTVLGLVNSFQAIDASGGVAQPAQLASGIWAALLTTVFGLAVGIPCMVAHHYFHSLTEKNARQMKELVSELDEAFDTGCDLCQVQVELPNTQESSQLYEERT
jgi:biopolymer transport protein ExbB